MKRKSSKATLGAVAVPSRDESIQIRKISNGFVVSRSGCDSKGNWKSTEVFTPTRPTVAVPKGKAK